ncbi:hypothetical protein Pcinc_011310 [Petrolisthes cinctipes]|uniref:Hexosyltransferase n=1 Tax=Petrolisthes cinctipes TaxID=88211 RepID=A0AAE1KSN5_PETCI|nr:hypothetical protein Pcinc_011310 [Petrolisthes cinctipes]
MLNLLSCRRLPFVNKCVAVWRRWVVATLVPVGVVAGFLLGHTSFIYSNSSFDQSQAFNDAAAASPTPGRHVSECNLNIPTISTSELPEFLIAESDFCTRRVNLTMVAYVHSHISGVEKRQETRATWASRWAEDLGVRLATVFMVGRARTQREKEIVERESRLYGDIVQGNYTDTYYTLSLKALMALDWVQQHCSHVPWILHADDDVLIDTVSLSKFLKARGSPNKLFCHAWRSSLVRRTGKWCVEKYEFPGKKYPPYCAGGAWVVANKGVPRLLKAATHAPPLWVDDVYVTGILARKASLRHSWALAAHFRMTGIEEKDLGNTMVWFNVTETRTEWWRKLVKHHGLTLPHIPPPPSS